MDHTGTFWVTAFNETADKVLGITANALMKLKVSSSFPLKFQVII